MSYLQNPYIQAILLFAFGFSLFAAVPSASLSPSDTIVNASDIVYLTPVNQGDSVNETVTIATEPVKVISGNTIGGVVVSITGIYSTTISVTGTASFTAGSYSGNITVQDQAGNIKVIIVSILVQEAI